MATMYIAEIDKQGVDSGSFAVIAASVPSVIEQTVAIGGSSTASATFSPTTRFVEISVDVPCSIVFGVNPVATTQNRRLAANETRYFSLKGSNMKVAVIANV